MRVVSDTSPLTNLAVIGRLHLLRDRYETVVVPPMVRRELDAFRHEDAQEAIRGAFRTGWLVEDRLPAAADLSAFLERADPGECEAIALAESIKADKILLDDRAGRELARERGLKISGVLGELLHAKRKRRVASVRDEMAKLQADARFFIREDLKAFILAEAGE